MFETKFVRKMKTPILCLIIFFRKSGRLLGNVEKYVRASQVTDHDIANTVQKRCHWLAASQSQEFRPAL